MVDHAASLKPAHAPADADAAITRGAFSWALYEGARNPYVVVCAIYVFAPYVAVEVIGDPIEGQAQIADLNKWAGLAAAIVAPVMGAAADRAGRRKRPLGLVTGLMAAMIACLWFITPAGPAGPAWLWFPLLLAVSVLFPLTEALHNAMLPTAASPRALPAVSGLGLALGNATSVAILLFVLVFLAFPGNVDWPFVPDRPAFGLDPAQHEPQRIVTVICAVWLAVFSLPMFFYTKDTAQGRPWGAAIAEGALSVVKTLRSLGTLGEAGRFLLARMFYTDAKTAIIVLGGVYAAGVMGWGLIEMTIYGIILSILAVLGGFVGGWLDMGLGPKRALQIEIGACALGLLGLVSIDRDTMFFVIETGPAAIWGVPFFETASEVALILVVCLLAVFITAAYASSRTMMSRLAPPERTGELFGLYALAGAATAWLGPMMVAAITRATQSQQIGFGSLIILLAVGFILLARVQAPPAP